MNERSKEEVYLEGGVPAGVICWIIHHGTLIEVTREPMANRVGFIERTKSREEIPVRLKWMRPVWGKLPASVVEAGRRLAGARKTADRTGSNRAYSLKYAAEDKWYDAVKRCQKSIEKLHAEECPGCPWNGKTLFPDKWR